MQAHLTDVIEACFCHPNDDTETRAAQEATVSRLFKAARRNKLEFLLEIIPSKVGAADDMTVATLIHQFYAAGIYPDWWKLEPMKTQTGWANAIAAIEAHDTRTRGIVVLGLDAPEAELSASFQIAAGFDLVKGFAVGRTIFSRIALPLIECPPVRAAPRSTRRSRSSVVSHLRPETRGPFHDSCV